jgi:DNA-binding transcriptional MerR regulator
MKPTRGRTYRIREFATLAGVTVRTLHHYDRLGLLTPRRSAAGYRIYSEQDLATLEQVVVLKFIGIPLRGIASLRNATPERLSKALLAQREMLGRQRLVLDQAIAAIRELQTTVDAGGTPPPALFKHIIEVIEMNTDAEARKQEYDALVQAKVSGLRSLSPEAMADMRRQWSNLVSEIRGALNEDPKGAKAQAFADRWSHLLRTLTGQPVSTSRLAEHHRTQAWTPQMSSFVDQEVWTFMARVLAARP